MKQRTAGTLEMNISVQYRQSQVFDFPSSSSDLILMPGMPDVNRIGSELGSCLTSHGSKLREIARTSRLRIGTPRLVNRSNCTTLQVKCNWLGSYRLHSAHTGICSQVIFAAALLLSYWALVMFVPVPGYGTGTLRPDANLPWTARSVPQPMRRSAESAGRISYHKRSGLLKNISLASLDSA